MEWVETTRKTVEEAKEAALDELGVDEHDAEFEILEEPKLGLFGRVRTEARVRARVRPTAPRAKEDRRDRRRRNRSAAASDSPDGTRTASDAASSAALGDATPGVATDDDGEPELTPTGSAEPAKLQSRRRRSSRSRHSGTGATATSPESSPDALTGSAGSIRQHTRAAEDHDLLAAKGDTLMDVALDEQGKVAEQFLTGLLAAFGVDATITVEASDEEDRVEIRLDGPGLGLLIGPKGATLLAIQDLTRTAVVHRTNARNGHLYVDVAGYRRQRAAALTEFASKVAADVLADGKPIALEPMNAADRKLVHDAVTPVEGVETRSDGEDDRRHVVILPVGWTAEA